ncbi:MAG TPA: extracellular solute-binding protein [Anaerolineae bacterium]|nr:extracellular solute-binding protein [Anaerolineae bacterium]
MLLETSSAKLKKAKSLQKKKPIGEKFSPVGYKLPMNVKHHQIRSGWLVLFFTFLPFLAGCAGKREMPDTPSSPQLPNQQITLTFATSDWFMSTYQAQVEEFETLNPNIQVQLVSIEEVLDLRSPNDLWPDDAGQRLMSAADASVIPVEPKFLRPEFVQDLSPFIDREPTFGADDYYPGVLESLQWGGGTWGLPMTADVHLIIYDKDIFDQAGMPYPKPGWTWNEFLATAQALTEQDGATTTRWGFVERLPDPAPFIQGRTGESWVDIDTTPISPMLDRPEMIDAVNWYVDLALVHKVMPQSRTDENEKWSLDSETAQMIQAGKAAMWGEGFGSWSWWSPQGRLGVVPFPSGNGNAATSPVFAPVSYAMSQGTAYPQAVWQWLLFLSNQSLETGSLPPRRSVAEASGFWDTLDEEVSGTLQFAFDHAFSPSRADLGEAFSTALEDIFENNKPVEQALAEAQVQALTYLEDNQAAIRSLPSISVAPPVAELNDEDAVHITFMLTTGYANLAAFRRLAESFQAIHPGIVVEVMIPDLTEGMPDFVELAQRSDCFQTFPSSLDMPENQAAILNLSPFIEIEQDLDLGDFYPQLLEQFTDQGMLWGLPATGMPYVIAYNKEIFDAAGISYPAPDWTTDDFLAIALNLTEVSGQEKRYGFVPDVVENTDLLLFIELRGGQLINNDVEPLIFTFDEPDTVTALQWYVDLTGKHSVKPVFLTGSASPEDSSGVWTKRKAMIENGQAAMWSHFVSTGGSANGTETGIAPLPLGVDGQRRVLVIAEGYFISAQSISPQACWDWMSYLTGQTAIAIEGMPARRSIAESAAYREQVGAGTAEAYLTSMSPDAKLSAAHHYFFDEGDWRNQGMQWFYEAYQQNIMTEKEDVASVLSDLQQKADEYRACVIENDVYSERDAWIKCILEL